MSAINLALGKLAYSSSSVLPYTAVRAVDGTLAPTNRWLCGILPGWICVDLGDTYRVNRWVVRNMSASGWASPDYNMVDFRLQVSNFITSERDMGNNALWTDVDVVTDNSLSIVDRTLAGIAAYRYFRLYVSKGLRCNTQLASVMELEIYKAPDSSRLTSLALSSGTLTPSFNINTTAYTAQAAYDISSITLTPTAEQSNAIIKVNGVAATNGQPSAPVSLNVGSNEIPVQVTAGDGTSQTTYTVAVTRASSPYLTGMVLKSGKSSISYTPGFDKNITQYTTAFMGGKANITVTPTAEDSNASINVGGTVIPSGQGATLNIPAGNSTIKIIVTSNIGGETKEYDLNVVN